MRTEPPYVIGNNTIPGDCRAPCRCGATGCCHINLVGKDIYNFCISHLVIKFINFYPTGQNAMVLVCKMIYILNSNKNLMFLDVPIFAGITDKHRVT